MINLLPPDVKENITYARRNTRLWHWSLALVIGMVGIVGIVGIGYVYMQNSINSYSALVQKGKEDLEAQKLDDTQKQVQEISSSLKLVTQVLKKEVLFSKLISQIGSALPNGSVLSGLSINKVDGGLNLSANAVDIQTATQVQVNLQDAKNEIFEKSDILNVGCAAENPDLTNTTFTKYPCNIELRTLFAKNNTFTFLNSATGSKTP